jgi:hypothetical protein
MLLSQIAMQQPVADWCVKLACCLCGLLSSECRQLYREHDPVPQDKLALLSELNLEASEPLMLRVKVLVSPSQWDGSDTRVFLQQSSLAALRARVMVNGVLGPLITHTGM